MLRTFLSVARLLSIPVLELAGSALVVAAVYGLAGEWWACLTAGFFLLLKAFERSFAESGGR